MNSLSLRKKLNNVPSETWMLILTMVGVFAGIAFGTIGRFFEFTPYTIYYIGFPGEIFMNLLKMIIFPLISISLISGLSQLDAKQSGRIGAYALLYYAVTTTMAVSVGIILVVIIHPGNVTLKTDFVNHTIAAQNISSTDKMFDLLRNFFPENLVRSTSQQVETKLYLDNTHTVRTHHTYVDGMNVLGIIMASISAGLIMGSLGKKVQPVIDIVLALDLIVNKAVYFIMLLSPIGIGSLIATKLLGEDDLVVMFRMLGMYVFTVILGLFIHLFISLCIVYFVATRKNPFTFYKGMIPSALTALGTASSAASLPVTFQCLEKNNHINPLITKFVLPVGATVNMDGTALYEAVASIFIAQMNGMELGLDSLIIVSITATLAAIGAASIPSAGLVTMVIILTALGLPLDQITLILSVDWLLDRLRTCVNVLGDAVGCGFVAHFVQIESVKDSELGSDNISAQIISIDIENVKDEVFVTEINK